MASTDYKIGTLCADGQLLSDDEFEKSGGEITVKDGAITAGLITAGAVTVQKLSDVANTNDAVITMSATTSTAMTTNATFFGAFVAPKACVVKSAHYVPVSDVTGADTNTYHVNLQNRGATGTSTTEMVSLEVVSGIDPKQYDPMSMGTVTATAGAVAAQVCVVAQYELVGNGLDAPAGFVAITYELNDE